MASTIELMGISFDEKIIEKHKVYAFQISSELKELFLEIMSKHNKYFKGRMVFEIGNALQQKEIIHCYGSIGVILRNQNVWFFANEPFEPELLFDFLKEWLKTEVEKVGINLSLIPEVNDWGRFIELSWAELLDRDKFDNGLKTLEKLFLSLIEDVEFDFITEHPKLMFHRVINEGESLVMSKPIIPTKGTAFSYTLKGKVKQLEGQDKFVFTYNPSVRLWIEETVIDKNKYLKKRESTNAYIYTTGLIGVHEKVVYNQLSLRKEDGLLKFHRLAHEEFVKKIGLNIEALLAKELEGFKEGETQLLITLPNNCRDGRQKVSRQKDAIPNSSYGLGLPERDKINEFVKKTLLGYGFNGIDLIEAEKVSSLSMNKRGDFLKLEKLREYNIEEYKSTENMPPKTKPITETNKISMNKKSFGRFDDKKTFKIAIFTASSVISDVLIGATRMFLYAENELKDNVYENSEGVRVEFDVIDTNITAEINSSKDVIDRTKMISGIVKNKKYDGAFIEIGKFGGIPSDPKQYIRAIFSELNIKTQFIHPASIKNQEILIRGIAASRDLLSKLGFAEPNLIKHFKSNRECAGVTTIEYRKRKIPTILKCDETGIKYKLYPEENWMLLEEVESKLTQKYILENEKGWETHDATYFPLYLNWISKQLKKDYSNKTEKIIFWDVRTNAILPKYKTNDCLFSENIEEVYNNNYIVVYQYANPNLGYLARDGKNELSKLKGVFPSNLENNKWYLTGTRVSSNGYAKSCVKVTDATNNLILPSLCEASIYTGLESVEHKKILAETQFLRLSSLALKEEGAYPYPLSNATYLEEIVSALMHRYSSKEKKIQNEEQKEYKVVIQGSLFE